MKKAESFLWMLTNPLRHKNKKKTLSVSENSLLKNTVSQSYFKSRLGAMDLSCVFLYSIITSLFSLIFQEFRSPKM